MASSTFNERERGDILVLFDVDDTLTPARQGISKEMIEILQKLRKKVVIGYVGGSDLRKQTEQLGPRVLEEFDYCFPENGLAAYKMGKLINETSFISWIGEEKYKKLVKFCLGYISKLDIPIMRGTFIEFRKGMINISPIGRNASIQERKDYQEFDLKHKIRENFIKAIQENFSDYGLTYSIGGEISFDVFPTGWDKTYCLGHVEDEGFNEIHFFGDKTYKGGNDYEIYNDPRTIGHSVKGPNDTARILSELFP